MGFINNEMENLDDWRKKERALDESVAKVYDKDFKLIMTYGGVLQVKTTTKIVIIIYVTQTSRGTAINKAYYNLDVIGKVEVEVEDS